MEVVRKKVIRIELVMIKMGEAGRVHEVHHDGQAGVSRKVALRKSKRDWNELVGGKVSLCHTLELLVLRTSDGSLALSNFSVEPINEVCGLFSSSGDKKSLGRGG